MYNQNVLKVIVTRRRKYDTKAHTSIIPESDDWSQISEALVLDEPSPHPLWGRHEDGDTRDTPDKF